MSLVHFLCISNNFYFVRHVFLGMRLWVGSSWSKKELFTGKNHPNKVMCRLPTKMKWWAWYRCFNNRQTHTHQRLIKYIKKFRSFTKADVIFATIHFFPSLPTRMHRHIHRPAIMWMDMDAFENEMWTVGGFKVWELPFECIWNDEKIYCSCFSFVQIFVSSFSASPVMVLPTAHFVSVYIMQYLQFCKKKLAQSYIKHYRTIFTSHRLFRVATHNKYTKKIVNVYDNGAKKWTNKCENILSCFFVEFSYLST